MPKTTTLNFTVVSLCLITTNTFQVNSHGVVPDQLLDPVSSCLRTMGSKKWRINRSAITMISYSCCKIELIILFADDYIASVNDRPLQY